MMKSVQRALTIGLLLAVSGLAAAVALKEGHPTTYFVKEGDTLWDISGRFLEHPWQWPELWQINEEISNPHLIYPGDAIRLVYVNGEPRLTVERGTQEKVMSNGVVKLSPKIREVDNSTAIPAIPLESIQAYLKNGLVLDREDIAGAPYVVGGRDGRVVFGQTDTVYARDPHDSWEDLQQDYGFYRTGEEYVDPDTNEILGYEARNIGASRTVGQEEEMATLRVTRSSEDIRVDDRIFPLEELGLEPILYPSAPDEKVSGKLIRFFDRINSVARNDVVVINLGERDGLKVGNVLDAFSQGEMVRDRQLDEMVRLPRERTGSLVVFKVFDKVSYALVMESDRPLYMHDIVESPAGSY